MFTSVLSFYVTSKIQVKKVTRDLQINPENSNIMFRKKMGLKIRG